MLGGASASHKRVLLLESFGRDFAPVNSFESDFREELSVHFKGTVEYFEVPLATARRSPGTHENAFLEYLQSLFLEHPADLIVTIGAPAARFLEQHRQQLFASTPALLTALDQRRVDVTNLTGNDAVVANTIDLGAAIDNILTILPDTDNIAVVVGDSPNERFWVNETRRVFQRFAGKVRFTWLTDLSFDEMKQRTATLPSRSAIFFGLFWVDATGAAHEGFRAIREIYAAANAPLFSWVDAYLGMGIVGGPLLPTREIAREAASTAIRILDGEKPENIERRAIGFAAPVYDGRELQRWHIEEASLPPGSQVQFRPVTVWQQYWWQLLLIWAVVLLQAALITVLLLERRRRYAAESESRHRLIEVAHLNRTATAGAMSASVAHELNQPLGAILNNTETAELLLGADNIDFSEMREILEDIRRDNQRATEIIKGMRTLLKRQEEVEIKELDINKSINDVMRIVEPEAKSREIIVMRDGEQRGLRMRADAVHVQQVILNLVLNAMEAMPTGTSANRRISIRTELVTKAEIKLSVLDNGPGIPGDQLKRIFEPFHSTKIQGVGLGLSIARTILNLYGGRIWAENNPAGGAVFSFTLPLLMAHAT
jgi:signal transduction histidine kinase